jgi:abhydrolase domain-containing protein 6
MTLSQQLRVALILLLILWLIARKTGFNAAMKKRKAEQERAAEKLLATLMMEEQKAERARYAERKKQHGAQALKSTLSRDFGMKQVDLRGQPMYYFEGGKHDGTVVLLLHGFASRKEDWVRFAQCLVQEGFHIIAPDLPGFGQNPKDNSYSHDVMNLTKKVRAFTEKLKIRGFHIVGSSLGGTVAGAYTYSFAKDVLSLTLIEPLCVRVRAESEVDELDKQGRNPLTIFNPDAYDNLLDLLYVTKPFMTDTVKRHRAEEAAKNREFYLKVWREIRSGKQAHILDQLLPEINKKTLVLHGSESRVVHPMTAQMIKQVIKVPGNTKVAVIEGCGHFPAVEKPELSAGHFLRFLGGR